MVRLVENIVGFSQEKLLGALSPVLVAKAAKYEKWSEDSDFGVGRRGQLLSRPAHQFREVGHWHEMDSEDHGFMSGLVRNLLV